MPCQQWRTLSQKKSARTSCGERDLRLILQEYLLRLNQAPKCRLVPRRLLVVGLLLLLARSHLSCLTGRSPNRCTSRAVTTPIPPKLSLAYFSDSLTISVLPKGHSSMIQLALLQAALS